MGKNLFILAILTMGLMACSTKEDVADEREPLKPETPVEKDEWETILPDGGVIERDDITIQFPKGTFSSETKVAVSEVKKGQILGEEEVSKFYQITLPYSCAKDFKVTIKCDMKGDDINAVVHSPAMAVGPNKQIYADHTVESSYSNGEYTINIPASDNKDTDATENASISIGLAHMLRIPGESAGTRAVDGITWHYDISVFFQQKYLANWKKADYPGSIRSALQHLQSLGFKFPGKRNISITWVKEDNEDISGHLVQDAWCDIWNGVALNELYISNFDKYNADNPVKRTCIHELMHVYQSNYDPRWPVVKRATDGDERMIYECSAVWSEKFNDGGTPSSKFISLYLPRFIKSLTEVVEVHKGDNELKGKKPYGDHGYGMSALIEYFTTQRKSEGFNDKSVVEIYEMMKNCSTDGGFALSMTTFDLLKAWAKKHNSKFFDNDGYDDFVLKLATGKVISDINANNLVSGEISQISESSKVEINGDCYPYGGLVQKVHTKFGAEYNNKGAFDNKQLVIEQKNEGVQTYVVVVNKNGAKLIDGKAVKDSPLIIDGKTLESLRVGDNYNMYFYPISTNCKNQTTLKSEVSMELKEQDFAITKITEITFYSDLKMKDQTTGKEVKYTKTLSKFDKCTIKQEGSTIHVECSYDKHEDYGKDGYNINTRSLSFDIVGFTEDTYDDKYGKIYCNVKNLKCSDYWKRDYGDSKVNYNIWEYEWELSNMNPQYGSKIGYLTFGGEWSHGFFTLDKFSYKETWKDWNKSEQSHTYSIIEDGDNIINLKLEYEYTTKKK
jgi:hypothetical protein